MCNTIHCDYLPHTTFCFYLINFQFNTDFPSQFCIFFTVKSSSVTQRLVSQENAFKKSKNPLVFFIKLWAQIVYFNCKEFQVFKIAKFEFKVTVRYGL